MYSVVLSNKVLSGSGICVGSNVQEFHRSFGSDNPNTNSAAGVRCAGVAFGTARKVGPYLPPGNNQPADHSCNMSRSQDRMRRQYTS